MDYFLDVGENTVGGFGSLLGPDTIFDTYPQEDEASHLSPNEYGYWRLGPEVGAHPFGVVSTLVCLCTSGPPVHLMKCKHSHALSLVK